MPKDKHQPARTPLRRLQQTSEHNAWMRPKRDRSKQNRQARTQAA
jgi:hypothetical protein